MKKFLIVLAFLVIILLGFYGYRAYQELQGAGPAFFRKPAGDIAKLIEEQNKRYNNWKEGDSDEDTPNFDNPDFPLSLPPNFRIGVFADDLSNARVMAFDHKGNLWVSRTREGIVTMLDIEGGEVVGRVDIFKGLNNPHGLAFDYKNPGTLFLALEDGVYQAPVYRPGICASEDANCETMTDIEQVQVSLAVSSQIQPVKIIDLPDGGGHRNHFTRTIKFGPDDKLYVAIGSSCNVCEEDDDRRAKIFRMNRDGSEWEEVATGLRNTVFFDWSYVTGDMWGADMGRDELGDDLPPDEINIIEEGKDYGWPICYGKQVHDTDFDTKQYVRDPCEDTEPSYIDLPAHVAPLGIAFVPEEGWPEEYWYDLLVAYHGSWNRSEPVGYKIERLKLSAEGEYLGSEPFIDGFLADDSEAAYGRPVDIITQPGGVMYVSDDHAGVIYRVWLTQLESNQWCYNDSVCVDTVMENETNVKIRGRVRGVWSFEASFPITINLANGNTVESYGTLEDDWMTEEFVPFHANITIPAGEEVASITLKKDNPSGMPELDDQVTVSPDAI